MSAPGYHLTELLRALSDRDTGAGNRLLLDETAQVLGLSLATVERDGQAACAWLFKSLSGPQGDDA